MSPVKAASEEAGRNEVALRRQTLLRLPLRTSSRKSLKSTFSTVSRREPLVVHSSRFRPYHATTTPGESAALRLS